jgi:hypothetical protein
MKYIVRRIGYEYHDDWYTDLGDIEISATFETLAEAQNFVKTQSIKLYRYYGTLLITKSLQKADKRFVAYLDFYESCFGTKPEIDNWGIREQRIVSKFTDEQCSEVMRLLEVHFFNIYPQDEAQSFYYFTPNLDFFGQEAFTNPKSKKRIDEIFEPWVDSWIAHPAKPQLFSSIETGLNRLMPENFYWGLFRSISCMDSNYDIGFKATALLGSLETLTDNPVMLAHFLSKAIYFNFSNNEIHTTDAHFEDYEQEDEMIRQETNTLFGLLRHKPYIINTLNLAQAEAYYADWIAKRIAQEEI